MKPFFKNNSGKTRRITPEGEPLEETRASGGFPGRGGVVSLVEDQEKDSQVRSLG